MANNFLRKIKLIPAWISEFFHFCPLQRRKSVDNNLFLIIGHRGSPGREIENTINSFDRAMREGANALEIDLSMTADGAIVLWHDWDPNDTVAILRESGFEPFVRYKPHPPALGKESRRKLSSMDLKEFRENFDYKLRHSNNSESVGAYIPTLRDFFEWSKGQENLHYVFFDIKCPASDCDLSVNIMERIQELMEEYKPRFRAVMETAIVSVYEKMKSNMNGFDCSLDIEAPAGIILDPTEYSSVSTAIINGNRFAIAMRPRKITIANWTTYRRIIRHDIKLRKNYNLNNPNKKIYSLICATVNKPA